jgi:hypothetical protein
MDELPIVNFGKYKNKPITDLLNDTEYVQWIKDTLVSKEWFKNNKVYNIIINNTFESNNTRSPEHNKLQNIFLNVLNREKLLNIFYNSRYKICRDGVDIQLNDNNNKIKFESNFNWDIWLYHYNIDNNERILLCELKPLLGDDYPCVLRKINNQIRLMFSNYISKNVPKIPLKDADAISYKYRRERECKEDFKKHHKFCLIIKEFNSENTTIDELKQIFNQHNISILFINDILNYKSNNISLKLESLIRIRKNLLQEHQLELKNIDEEINNLNQSNQ